MPTSVHANKEDLEKTDSCEMRVPYFPWFMDHVKTSIIKRSFTCLYFTVGLVEEAAELSEELKKRGENVEAVVGEVGDVCWYVYGLCQSLDNIIPQCDNSQDYDSDSDLLSVVGQLCGSIKKWSRGDQTWDTFQPRVQTHVSRVLSTVSDLSPVPLEQAMRSNIEKIRDRRARGVVRGDGNTR